MKDKEKQITINREAGATADLLNKEIEELQKANAIVEMQNVVCKRLCNQDCRICNYYNKNDCIQKDNVDALYERGYRKLPEDSVVLSREEQEKILKATESRINKLKEQVKQVSKETAEKFAKLIGFHSISKRDESGYETFTISNLCMREILREEFGFTNEELETM